MLDPPYTEEPAQVAMFLPAQPSVTFELLIGRTLAYCVHPTAAWRVASARGRAGIVGAYAAAGYAAVLAALLLR